MSNTYMNEDVVVACLDLISRCGAKGFEIGYLHDGVEEAGWYAHASYQGARITVDDHRSPSGAALALAERLLRGAQCRCRKTVTLSDDRPGCRWRLVGKRWEPACDAPPVRVNAPRGDLSAMQRAMSEPANRAERRARNVHPRPGRGGYGDRERRERGGGDIRGTSSTHG